MSHEGDRLLNIVGVLLLLGLVVGMYVIVTAGTNSTHPQSDSPAPDTEWSLEHVNDTHLRLVYRGGDPVSAGSLSVTVDGDTKSPSWSGRLTRGDGAVIEAERGQVIRLYWQSRAGNRTLLRQW